MTITVYELELALITKKQMAAAAGLGQDVHPMSGYDKVTRNPLVM